MRCKCGKPAIIENPSLCKDHFQKWIEREVRSNVKKHKLFEEDDVLVCAVSGGKDSLTVMYLMKELFPNKVNCLTVDEGIKGYRDTTLPYVKRYCKEWGIPLHVFSFKAEFGKQLDKMKDSNCETSPNCSLCGVFRRSIMNRKSRELGDVLITGHNLDDEVQTIFMNLIQNDYNRLARMGFIAGIKRHKKFIPRVKPLRSISEKQIATYFFSKEFDTSPVECPYVTASLRHVVREQLNEFEFKYPGSKLKIINWFDKIKPTIETRESKIILCERCGEPSSKSLCEACETISTF